MSLDQQQRGGPPAAAAPEPVPSKTPHATPVSPALVVAIMTLVQTTLSMGLLSLPITGPYAAAEVGLSPLIIDAQISVLYVFGIVSSLVAARLVRRYGGACTSQIALAFMTAGLLAAMVPTLPTMALGVVLMGLAYGIPNPAASHVLNRFLGVRNRNLMFSIKQAGVPLGGVLAGFVAAPLSEWLDWRLGLLVPALAGLLLMFCIIPFRARWDDDRNPKAKLIHAPFAGFGMILRLPATRLIFFSGITLSAAQLCLSTFLVLLLINDYGYDPVHAGAVLAGVQGAGFFGRLFWGALGDRIGSGVIALFFLSVMLCVLTGVLALVDLGQFHGVLFVLLLGIGMSASGWSGVLIAEVDRFAPRGHVSEATATLMAGTFFGVTAGTALFTGLISVFGSFRNTFIVISGTALLSALMFLTIVIFFDRKRAPAA